jgi:phosphoglycolate phosphatase
MKRATKQPRAVLFDLDGTLSDSLPDIEWALNEARIEAGLTPATEGQVKSWVGGGAEVLVVRSLGAKDASDPRVAPLLKTFLDHYEAHACDRSRLYPGVIDLLDRLEDRGIATAVTTNKPRSAARALLEGLEIVSRLDLVVTPDCCGSKKPDPLFLHFALEKLGVAPRDALVVGDGVPDVEAARGAGIKCVAILGGYGDPKDLRAAGADEYVASIAEFAKRFE